MKFNNPWIDARVQYVRATAAEAYLLQQRWKRVPFPRDELHIYASPIADSGEPITQPVPMNEQASDYVQGIIDLITNLAILEDRAAAAVLDDMLSQSYSAPSENGGDNVSRSKKRRSAG